MVSPVKIGNFVELDGPPAIKNQQVDTATTEGVGGIALPKDINETVLNYQKKLDRDCRGSLSDPYSRGDCSKDLRRNLGLSG
jgi:hypothetical protein